MGHTGDIRKVFHNFEQMGEWGKEQEQNINIKLLLVKKGIEAVSDVGRYVCVIRLTMDGNETSMTLCDSTIRNESWWQGVAEKTFPNLTVEFMNVYRAALLSSSSFERDTYTLSTNALYLEMP